VSQRSEGGIVVTRWTGEAWEVAVRKGGALHYARGRTLALALEQSLGHLHAVRSDRYRQPLP
jgi:hypothetical protein